MGDGYRVTDRATAVTLLAMAGVNVMKGRPAEAFAEAIQKASLNSINAAEGELTTFGDAIDLGRIILDVAQASIRVDQLRWLAVRQPPTTFPERVTERIRNWVVGERQVQQKVSVPLRSGRSRPVTLRVSNSEKSAYIQAVGSQNQEHAVEHCYYIFDLSEVPKDNRIAALDGHRKDWPDAIIKELMSVGNVTFFEDPLSLERRLDAIVPPPQPLSPV
jgi:hypothetical protein